MSRFPLPTMPFHREVTVAIGTQIRLTAKPYPDAKKLVNFKLINSSNDIGLNIQFDLGQNTKITINSTVSGQTSSSLEYSLQIPFERSFVLVVNTLQHSFQITLNNIRVADFVHRIDPTSLSTISITGPLICEEVDISQQQEPLPSYEQVTTQMMRNMNLGDTTKPSAPPVDLPPPPPNVLNPSTSTSSSFFYTGNSQGFSNHPYPLPGLIDNTTHSSQQLPTQPLPAQLIPTQQIPAQLPSTQPFPTQPLPSQPLPSSTHPTNIQPTVPVSSVPSIPSNISSPPYPSQQPYTVQFPPQTPASTPSHYQNAPTPLVYPPPLPPQFPSTVSIPSQPYLPPLPVTVPQAQVTVLPPQQYVYPPQAYVQGYPYGGVYYTPEYYPHHHHHHGHHHHHCD